MKYHLIAIMIGFAEATIQGLSVSHHQATVNFTAPDSDGGAPITAYTVQAFTGGTPVTGKTCILTGAFTVPLHCTVTGLTNGKSYTFTVTATNSVGISGESAPSAAVTPTPAATAPSAPTAVTTTAGDGQIDVGWTAPESDGGDPISSYTVTALIDGKAVPGRTCTITGPFTPQLGCTVTGLTNGTAYTFTVTANNTVGAGLASLPSDPVAPIPAPNAPAAPTSVTATPGDAQATVTFTAPTDNGGAPITSYEVQASASGSPVGGAICTVTVTAAAPQSPLTCTVTGLHNGTVYTFTVTATNSAGTSAPSVPSNTVTPNAQVVPGSYYTVPPSRVLDTRHAIGAAKAPVAARSTVTFNLPRGSADAAGAVALEVTAVNPAAAGFLTVYPTGSGVPTASNLNFQSHQDVPNLVVVRLGAGGKVSIFNGSNGPVDILADLHGYFRTGQNTGNPGTLVPMTPTRFLDTRSGVGTVTKGRVMPLSVTKVKIAGAHGLPANVSAVALNITAVHSPGKGYITAYPGAARPKTSTLNYETGQDRANLALVEVGADGTVSLFNGSAFPVDLVADVSGYFVSGTPTVDGAFVPFSPVREVDTRQAHPGFVPALATLKVRIFKDGDPLAAHVKAVAVNVTAVNPEASGFFTTSDGSVPMPAVSNSNFQAKHDGAGSVIVPVNADGTISVYNGSYGNVDIIVDINGIFTAVPQTSATPRDLSPTARSTTPSGQEIARQLLAQPHSSTLILKGK